MRRAKQHHDGATTPPYIDILQIDAQRPLDPWAPRWVQELTAQLAERHPTPLATQEPGPRKAHRDKMTTFSSGLLEQTGADAP